MRQLLFDLSSDPVLAGAGVYYHVPTEKIEVLRYEAPFYPVRNYQTTSSHVGKRAGYKAFEDASFIQFRGIARYPFAERISLDVTPGDIALQPFVDGFEVYAESAPGANDGRLIIHARSQVLAGETLQYSLNGNSFQASNTFTGITPGVYSVKVKFAATFSYDVLIPGYPTYNPRWIARHKDYNNRNTTILIEKLGYAGTAEQLKYTEADPLIMRFGKKGDDRYTIIKGGEAEMNLASYKDFQFAELFSSHERQFRVSVYKESQLVYRGFILSDIYREPYVAIPYPVNVSATDGLALLSEIPFLAGNYKVYGKRSLLQILSICLAQTGLELNIITSIHTYNEQHAFGNDDDPLAQTYVDSAQYEGMMCSEVIERILRPFRARLRQWMGAWVIEEVGISINKPRLKAWRGREFDAYCEGGEGATAWRGRESDAYCEQS